MLDLSHLERAEHAGCPPLSSARQVEIHPSPRFVSAETPLVRLALYYQPWDTVRSR